MVLPGQLGTLLYLGIGGVGHDAGELGDGLAGGLQDADQLLIDAVFLDGPTAIGQQHVGTIARQDAGQVLPRRTLAEIDLGGIFIDEIFHKNASFLQISRLGRTPRSETSTLSGWDTAYSTALAMTSGSSPTFL